MANMLRTLSTRIFSSSLTKSNLMLSGARLSRGIATDSDSDIETAPALQNLDNFKCINRVTLLGRATGPVLPQSPNSINTEMATFILATNEIRRNRANELIKRSEFHRVQVFIPRLAQKAKQAIDKGSRVLVEGKINYYVRKAEDGTNLSHTTNIIADNIVFITGKQFERIPREYEGDEDQEKATQ